jgi:hypothetical protein
MKCPHCLLLINENFTNIYTGNDKDGCYSLSKMTCPNPKCKKLIIKFSQGEKQTNGFVQGNIRSYYVRPRISTRTPVPHEVDKMFSSDYNEACLVLDLSPKASAALSRRCLQNILREKAGVKKGDLAREIQEVIDSGKIPSYLSENIDAVRNIGNFAAHPQKSTATGEIIDVEPGEAEWMLDVLEMLFDFYFVQPALAKTKRDALNQKLQEAGKPAMK